MRARCKQCEQVFNSNHDFNEHDCPWAVEPLDGESWDDFKARAEKIRAEKIRGAMVDGGTS